VPIVVRNRFTYPSTHDNATSNVETPTPVIPNRDGVPNGRNDISNIFSGSIEKPLLHPSSITTKPVPVSLMMEGNLIHRVEPQYPAIARQIRLQGTVVLRAMIGSDGTIERIRVISGHPILAQAAREAVNQWRYRPYFLNGMAIPVETEVTVNFVLNQ